MYFWAIILWQCIPSMSYCTILTRRRIVELVMMVMIIDALQHDQRFCLKDNKDQAFKSRIVQPESIQNLPLPSSCTSCLPPSPTPVHHSFTTPSPLLSSKPLLSVIENVPKSSSSPKESPTSDTQRDQQRQSRCATLVSFPPQIERPIQF